MPRFEVIPWEEALRKSSTTGRRGQILKEYLGYLDRLKEGQAGRLQVSEGEKIAAVRRRLGTAAKLAGKQVVIKRVGEEILFWTAPPGEGATGRKRGRPRRASQPSP